MKLARWLFTSVAEDLNSGWTRTNAASDLSGTRARDLWTTCQTRWPCGHTASSYDLFAWLEMCVCTLLFHFNAPKLQGTAKSLTLLAIYYHDCLVQQSIINIKEIIIINQLTVLPCLYLILTSAQQQPVLCYLKTSAEDANNSSCNIINFVWCLIHV